MDLRSVFFFQDRSIAENQWREKCDTVLWTSLDWGYGIWDTINNNQTDRAIVWGLYLGLYPISHVWLLHHWYGIQTCLAKTDICWSPRTKKRDPFTGKASAIYLGIFQQSMELVIPDPWPMGSCGASVQWDSEPTNDRLGDMTNSSWSR